MLHWYHPLVWLAVYVSCQDSELACDERVVRQLGEGSRSAYGRVLLDMTVGQGHKADFLCCATTMTADGRSLKERIQMIAFRPRTRAVTGVAVAALMLGTFCVACTGVKGDVDSDAASGSRQESGENDKTVPEQNGQKYMAYVSMICQCSWSMLSDDVLPTAVLDYVMERQADGSWRMVEDCELPVSLTLKEDSKYGLYMTMVGEVPCLLNLDRDGTFSFYEAISSILTDSMRGRFEWSDEMLELKFVDSDIVWYLQMQDGGRWNLIFREDLSTQPGNVLLPDGIVFERIS